MLRQPIGVLDFSSPLLPESFRGPTDLWNAVIRILRLLPPDGVSKILFPRAPISRLDSLAALGLAKGCELDLRGVQSPWFPAFLAALAHSMPQKVKLGDAPRVHDAPEPVRPSGLRRLFGQPVIEWTPEHHDFRHAALEASAKLVQPKDLEIEMVEMGVWWTTGNLRVLLSSWGAGLERFSVKLGKTPGTLDERDVEVRKRGPLAWLERKLFVVREGERKVGRTEDDGLQGVDSWSYGDETEVRLTTRVFFWTS